MCIPKQHALSTCALFAGRLRQKPGEKPGEAEKEVDAEMQDANGEAHAEAEAEEQGEMEAADGEAEAEDATEQPAAHTGKVSYAFNAEHSPCFMRGHQGLASCNAHLRLLLSAPEGQSAKHCHLPSACRTSSAQLLQMSMQSQLSYSCADNFNERLLLNQANTLRLEAGTTGE